MRGGPAEIDLDAVAAILRHVPAVALDDRFARLLVVLHHRPEILGVQRRGEPGRVDEVAEHGRDLAPFGRSSLDRRSALGRFVALGFRCGGRRGSKFGDGREQRDARADRQTDPLQHAVGEMGQRAEVDLVVLEGLRVLAETEALQPC